MTAEGFRFQKLHDDRMHSYSHSISSRKKSVVAMAVCMLLAAFVSAAVVLDRNGSQISSSSTIDLVDVSSEALPKGVHIALAGRDASGNSNSMVFVMFFCG